MPLEYEAGVRSNGWIMSGKTCNLQALNHVVEEIPRQGRQEGWHRMSAATHHICGLEGM